MTASRVEPAEYGGGGVAVRRRPGRGPYDEDEVGPDGIERTDFGALLIPVPEDGTITVEPSTSGKLQAVHLTVPHGRLSVSALAAPTTARLWPELAAEINKSLRDGGASVRSFQGRWGRELRARTGEVISVFVGIDGPRWMVYGVASGPGADARALDAQLRQVLGATVVVRGSSPYPVRTVLPLTVPEHLQPEHDAREAQAQATEAASAERADEPAEPAGPTGPAQPAGSARPAGPVQRVPPARLVGPAQPVGPAQQAAPAQPAEPITDAFPVAPQAEPAQHRQMPLARRHRGPEADPVRGRRQPPVGPPPPALPAPVSVPLRTAPAPPAPPRRAVPAADPATRVIPLVRPAAASAVGPAVDTDEFAAAQPVAAVTEPPGRRSTAATAPVPSRLTALAAPVPPDLVRAAPVPLDLVRPVAQAGPGGPAAPAIGAGPAMPVAPVAPVAPAAPNEPALAYLVDPMTLIIAGPPPGRHRRGG